MKKFLFLILVVLISFGATTVTAQTKLYKMGYKAQVSLTSATSVSVTPNATVTLYTIGADTNITFNAVTTNVVPADVIYFRVKGNTRQRVIVWGTNMDGLNDTIATNKTWVYHFIWDGTAFKKAGAIVTD